MPHGKHSISVTGAFVSGFQLNTDVLSILILRYMRKDGTLRFGDFVSAILHLSDAFGMFLIEHTVVRAVKIILILIVVFHFLRNIREQGSSAKWNDKIKSVGGKKID